MHLTNDDLHLSREVRAAIVRLQQPSRRRSLGQLASTLLPFAALVVLMYWTAPRSIAATLGLGVAASGFVLRAFSIQHDCGHGAFFASPLANQLVGRLCSMITLTPFASWRRQHSDHHKVWNNLDHRDRGADTYSTCLTVREYLGLPRPKRLRYRLLHHPVLEIGILPPLVFLLLYRFSFDTPRSWQVERRSVHCTNLALGGMALLLVALAGWRAVLLVHLPYVVFASIVGGWLFTIQHRFENAGWMAQDRWSRVGASFSGSSHLELPAALQWLVGNTGFHHIHHWRPRVPNYALAECHDLLRRASVAMPTLALRDAFRAPLFSLWDEERNCMARCSSARPGGFGVAAGGQARL